MVFSLRRNHKGIAVILFSLMFLFSGFPPQEAIALERHNSRLSQLIQKKPLMYLPTRLLIGQENKFVFKAQPGQKIVLIVSPQPTGFKAPDGQMLRVGDIHEKTEGVVPPNGILVLNIPVPNEEELLGKEAFVEALAWMTEDYSDLQIIEQLDPTGRSAIENKLVISKQESGKGTQFLPSMPGLQSDLLQRLNTFSNVQGDERKKDLIDQGEIEKETLFDRNNFLSRPNTLGTPQN